MDKQRCFGSLWYPNDWTLSNAKKMEKTRDLTDWRTTGNRSYWVHVWPMHTCKTRRLFVSRDFNRNVQLCLGTPWNWNINYLTNAIINEHGRSQWYGDLYTISYKSIQTSASSWSSSCIALRIQVWAGTHGEYEMWFLLCSGRCPTTGGGNKSACTRCSDIGKTRKEHQS